MHLSIPRDCGQKARKFQLVFTNCPQFLRSNVGLVLDSILHSPDRTDLSSAPRNQEMQS